MATWGVEIMQLANDFCLNTARVKQYNSTYKTVISVDGIPVCITRSNKRASDIVSYLSGYEAEINDGKLKKQLDKIKDKK